MLEECILPLHLMGSLAEYSLLCRKYFSLKVEGSALLTCFGFFLLFKNFFIYSKFIYLFIYLFIYFWLCWVFVDARGLSLVAVSRGFSCGAWDLGMWASVVVACGLSSCGTWA